MVKKDTLIKVSNRGRARVGYKVPELNVRRQFSPHETKELPMEELRALSYVPGGKEILEHYLMIEDPDAITELLGAVEPEYTYTEDDVRKLLLTGSLDQLLDCLDFAPTGVIDLVKTLAVELKINDLDKRQAILEKTGFNVTKAIEINEETEEQDSSNKNERSRRAAPMTEDSTSQEEPVRRSTIPQYKVVQS